MSVSITIERSYKMVYPNDCKQQCKKHSEPLTNTKWEAWCFPTSEIKISFVTQNCKHSLLHWFTIWWSLRVRLIVYKYSWILRLNLFDLSDFDASDLAYPKRSSDWRWGEVWSKMSEKIVSHHFFLRKKKRRKILPR